MKTRSKTGILKTFAALLSACFVMSSCSAPQTGPTAGTQTTALTSAADTTSTTTTNTEAEASVSETTTTSGTTTAAGETTTSAEETTTAAEETTTSAGETTTAAGETTTSVETTTAAASEGTTKKADTGEGHLQKVNRSGDLRKITSKGTLAKDSKQIIRRNAKGADQIVTTTFDGKKLPKDFYLYRNTLSGNLLSAYDTIYAGLITGSKSIKINVPINAEQLDTIMCCIIYDRPELFWLDLEYNYDYNNYKNITTLYMGYNSLVNDIKGNTEKLEKSVHSALSAMSKLPNDIERAKYAHDYLLHTVNYVSNDLDQVAYSALVNKKTVCAGYSEAFAYMMHKMGIQCAVAVGDSGGAHAWCKLILDGDCYAMDVTWDDPTGNPPNSYYYDYFNITDSVMGKDHKLDDISKPLPVAKGTKASFQNYFHGKAYGTDFGDGTPVKGEDLDSGDYDDGYYDYGDYDYGDYDYGDYDYGDYDYGDYDYGDYDYGDYDYGDYDYGDYDYGDYDYGYYDYGDYDYGDYYYDDYDYGNYDWNWNWDNEFGYYDYDGDDYSWWNYLYDGWDESDWEYDKSEEAWYLYDTDTEGIYMYFPDDDIYCCMGPDDDTLYMYDPNKNDWLIVS